MGKTKEQDVVMAKEKIATLKNRYLSAIHDYLAAISNKDSELLKLIECQQRGNEYFNYTEEFVGNSDLLGAHKSSLWAQGFAEDCAEILKSLPSHVALLKGGFAKYSTLESQTIIPTHAAYANMQRMVVMYLNKAIISDVKSSLDKANLPVYGFNNEAKELMSKRLQAILSFSFGVVFVIALIAIAMIKPNPTGFQYTVFRIVLALAGGGVVAVFPGFIEVKFGNWLRAGGALAVFAVIYFCTPAAGR
ncbi:MAG: hypothetical protein WCG53_02305 [Actinomycetes bacterium]